MPGSPHTLMMRFALRALTSSTVMPSIFVRIFSRPFSRCAHRGFLVVTLTIASETTSARMRRNDTFSTKPPRVGRVFRLNRVASSPFTEQSSIVTLRMPPESSEPIVKSPCPDFATHRRTRTSSVGTPRRRPSRSRPDLQHMTSSPCSKVQSSTRTPFVDSKFAPSVLLPCAATSRLRRTTSRQWNM